jgi:DNA-binding transcriptional regulator GbsR (MarR family)
MNAILLSTRTSYAEGVPELAAEPAAPREDAADGGTDRGHEGAVPARVERDREDAVAARTGRDREDAVGGTDRDREAVGRYVERFASVLVEAGIPRMPARVFAALLTCDPGSMTAAQLAGQLGASPAAVSGGVRYLTNVGLISREGEPGSRRHHYRIPDDVWQEVVSSRDRVMARWISVMRDGVDLLGPDTPAGARMADSVQYFEFVTAELPLILARWNEYKAALDRGGATQP